jgi:hypothetical protein
MGRASCTNHGHPLLPGITDTGAAAQLVRFDFGVPYDRPSSIDVAVEVADALNLSGPLFSSGGSFHFVSDQVVSDTQLSRVLARAQLVSPLIDSRWVSHQLIDGESRLRISTDTERNTVPHRLVTFR